MLRSNHLAQQHHGPSQHSSKYPVSILIAEDDPEDRMLTIDALDENNIKRGYHFVGDGEELMDYLNHRSCYQDSLQFPRPRLILLDLNMPKKDGREALQEIKRDENLKRIPIVILTTSKADEDVIRSYNLGVNSFITKPVSYQDLVEVIATLSKYWFQIVELPHH